MREIDGVSLRTMRTMLKTQEIPTWAQAAYGRYMDLMEAVGGSGAPRTDVLALVLLMERPTRMQEDRASEALVKGLAKK